MKDRHKYVVDTFKGVGTGLIVAGIIGVIFRKEPLPGMFTILMGIIVLLIGFSYLIKKEDET